MRRNVKVVRRITERIFLSLIVVVVFEFLEGQNRTGNVKKNSVERNSK